MYNRGPEKADPLPNPDNTQLSDSKFKIPAFLAPKLTYDIFMLCLEETALNPYDDNPEQLALRSQASNLGFRFKELGRDLQSEWGPKITYQDIRDSLNRPLSPYGLEITPYPYRIKEEAKRYSSVRSIDFRMQEILGRATTNLILLGEIICQRYTKALDEKYPIEDGVDPLVKGIPIAGSVVLYRSGLYNVVSEPNSRTGKDETRSLRLPYQDYWMYTEETARQLEYRGINL